MKQKRNFYLALPALVLPFITILFWALGGGSGPAQASAIANAGLNPDLPGAQFKDDPKAWDKLALYEKARHDSLAEKEARKNDPYFRFSTLTELQEKDQQRLLEENKINASLGKKDGQIKSDEEQVEQRLSQLYKAINNPQPAPRYEQTQPVQAAPSMTKDVDRLEQLMETMKEGHQENPELRQMDTMLEKILDIQHPERVKEKINDRKAEQAKSSFSVSSVDVNANVTTLDSKPEQLTYMSDSLEIRPYKVEVEANGFFGLNDEAIASQTAANAIEAVIHDTQTLVSGSIIKLRLSNDIEINGSLIPANSFVYGVATVNGERLSIAISSIRNGNSVLPVTLSVYDLDGMAGIYIPGAIERDAAKQATGESLDQMQLMNSMNTSLSVQAASAGIEAAKGLFSKKIKLVKVTVKAGYQILLKDSNQKV